MSVASNESDQKPAVQLGFSEPFQDDCDGEGTASDAGHRSPNWTQWDGGKIGGRPSWLNPRDLPFETPLRCRGKCCQADGADGTVMRFVAQLYCPADDVTDNAAAFHRSIYVFACPTCCSSESLSSLSSSSEGSVASLEILSKSVRVLRCQLPKVNDFYPLGRDEDDTWEKHTPEYWSKHGSNDKLNVCAVCGQRSKGKCPKQNKWFCGSEHQKEHMAATKQMNGSESGGKCVPLRLIPSIFHESDLVVDEEPSSNDGDGNGDVPSDVSSSGLFGEKSSSNGKSDGGPDLDASLEQSDLNAMSMSDIGAAATGVTDPTTLAFYARMAVGGKDNDVRDQCLRYSRWEDQCDAGDGDNNDDDEEEDGKSGVLWIRSEFRPQTKSKDECAADVEKSDLSSATSFPPPCQYCGALRKFEFQIMPQMIHYLLHGNTDDDDVNGDTPSSGANEALTEAQRAVLLEAASKIESGVELPEGFREQHEAALKNAREALLGNGKTRRGGKDAKGGLDWGALAVYTCTSSCGDGGVCTSEPKGLGAYREEVAWVQPPLD